jgi:hypothetical protein
MMNSKRCEMKLCGIFQSNFPAFPGGTEENKGNPSVRIEFFPTEFRNGHLNNKNQNRYCRLSQLAPSIVA